MSRKYFPLLFLVLLLAVLRFIWLGTFPPGLSNDETEYMISAKTYADFGRDVSGYGLPLSLFKSETDGVIAPMPAVLSAPFYWFLPLNLKTARLPFLVVNLLTAWGVYKLSYFLFKNKTGSLLTVIIFLINPWAWYLSRNTADAPFALLFYLWGSYLLLKNKNHALLWPFALFVLGFFSYHGAKTLFLPLITALLFYRSIVIKSLPVKQAVIFLLTSIIFFGAFLIIAKNIPGSVLSIRGGDVILDNSELTRLVDETRRQTIASPFQYIFINKYVFLARELIQRYLSVFDPATLFLRGDIRATYRFGGYGLLHIIDIVFIFTGIAFIAKKNTKKLILLALVVLVAPVTTMLSGVETSIINRSFLLLPIFVIFIAQGIMYLKKYWLFVVPALSLSFIYFLHFYFFTFPVTAQENYWVGDRVLVNYLSHQKKAVWITNEPWNAMMRVMFYADELAQDEYLNKTYPLNQRTSYSFKNTTITTTCPESLEPETVYAIPTRINCHNDTKADMTISDAKDSGDLVRIINDNCGEIELEPYRRFNFLSDYSVERMDRQTLCSRWFSRKD